jgi:type IX secretion system PorP/SprF family membrane protein
MCSAHAQQHALYSQYIFNLFMVNPAYAGSRDALAVNAGYRAQWVGFEGAPTTQNFSIHGPLRNKNMAFGLQLQNDEIGARRATSFAGTYPYALQLSRARKISFGLQAGLINYNMNWDALTYNERNDPAAFAIDPNQWIPNFDFGMMYISPRSYFGISASNLSQPGLSNKTNNDSRLATHIHVVGGKVFEITPLVSIKPGFLLRQTIGGPSQFEMSLGGLFANSLWITATYRHGFGMVASAHYYVTEKFHFGYSYDWTMGKIAAFQGGSHEIFIGYDIPIYKSARMSPRYF